MSSAPVGAQNVEGFFSGISQRLADRDYLRLSGRVGLSTSLNAFIGEAAARRQAPFTWSANAGINFDLLGIKAPFTAAFSSRNTTYNLPSYAFYGLSPTYKWITLHGGDRSMTFSPYSLSGVNYRGAGIELTPGRFRLSAMTGKLRRARIQDAGSIQDIESALTRRGSGLQLGYESKNGSQVTASFFSAADRLELTGPELDSLPFLRPEANQVLTLAGKHQFSDFLGFDFEVAQSVLTRDTRITTAQNPKGRTTQFGLFRPNASTTASRAARFSVNLAPKFGSLSFGYERIDPEYRTHGSLYFQNDLENFTTHVGLPLFDKKVNLSANVGVQRNDLDGQKAANLRRFIGALNANIAVSERVNAGVGLSNFTSTNRYKAISLTSPVVDSIVLAQTQLSVDANASFILDAASTQVLVVAASWQRAGLVRNETVDTSANSAFAMLMVNYTYQPQDGPGSFNGAVLLHRNATPGLVAMTLGPSAGYQRKVLNDKGSLRIGASYSLLWTDREAPGGGVVQVNLGGGYALGKKQSLSLNGTLVKVAAGGGRAAFTDLRLGVNYGYTFN